jgi:hypothetical protein
MHTFPAELSHRRLSICPERGILYAFVDDGHSRKYAIATSKTMPGAPDGYIWHDWTVHRMVDVKSPLQMFGDAQFLIFLGQSTLDIWEMDKKRRLKETRGTR